MLAVGFLDYLFHLSRPTLWCDNVAFPCTQAITDGALKDLGKGCPRLRHLSMSRCNLITNVGLRAIAYACPELHTLEVSHCSLLTDPGFLALASFCPMVSLQIL